MASMWRKWLVAGLVAGALGFAGCRTNTGEPAPGAQEPATGGSGEVDTGAQQEPMDTPDQSVGGGALEQEQQGTYPEASDESIGGSGAPGDAGAGFEEDPSSGGSGYEGTESGSESM